jgi:hypothetical protein
VSSINLGVAAYASSFGNSERRLDEWCRKYGTTGMRGEIISLVSWL